MIPPAATSRQAAACPAGRVATRTQIVTGEPAGRGNRSPTPPPPNRRLPAVVGTRRATEAFGAARSSRSTARPGWCGSSPV